MMIMIMMIIIMMMVVLAAFVNNYSMYTDGYRGGIFGFSAYFSGLIQILLFFFFFAIDQENYLRPGGPSQ